VTALAALWILLLLGFWLPIEVRVRLAGGRLTWSLRCLGVGLSRSFVPAADPETVLVRILDLPDEIRRLGDRVRTMARALRGLRVDDLELEARLGTGDAAGTALLLGWLWAAAGTALPWLRRHIRRRPRLHLEPDFEGASAAVDLRLRLVVRVGTLIGMGVRMGARAAAAALRRRIAAPTAGDISR